MKKSNISPIKETKNQKFSLTLNELKSMEDTFFKVLMKEKLHILTSYKLAKLAVVLKNELGILEKLRVDLVKQHGEAKYKEENSDIIKIPSDSEEFQAFAEDYAKLLEHKIYIDDFKKLSISNDFKDLTIKSDDILVLQPILQE